MPNFSKRSTKSELLDNPNIPKAELFQNLKELDTINRLLGGHKATLVGLKKLMTNKNKTYKIVDFACGGGDTLRVIYSWAKKNNYKVELIGFDLLPYAIEFAKSQSLENDINWKVADFNTFEIEDCDISICSLVCHHFYGDQLKSFILKMKKKAKLGCIINDLHRNTIAYYGIWLLTSLFSKSNLVKNDAKLSVLKGFQKSDWKKLFVQMNISNFSIQWIWAFRHLIIIK